MKLWKKTVRIMLATLLVSLGLVGGLTLWVSYENNISNAARTYGEQINSAARMLEQFWDDGKFQQMTEAAQRSYRNFQFRLCCGEGYALLDGSQVMENLTEYDIIDSSALTVSEDREDHDYGIQRLNGKYLLLQKTGLIQPEGYSLLAVREVTEIYKELKKLAAMYLGIYGGIFLLAGFFIYRMMRHTVRAMEELQEVAQKQEMLLGALAHEMKTPLTSIIGYSDSLLHVNLREEQRERALMHINREGCRLERLSGKLLQLIGLYRNDAIEMEKRPVSELIRRIEEVETEACLEKGIWLQTEYENFPLKMDMELMESLLLNLVDNAIRASGKGDRITLLAKSMERTGIIQVKDMGRGIPESELDKVTEAFYMVDKSRSRKEGGAGLGLALCREIARLHGAEMKIESMPGRGTTVTLEF